MGYRTTETLSNSKGKIVGRLITEADGKTQLLANNAGVIIASYKNGASFEGLAGRFIGNGNIIMSRLPRD